MLGIRSPVIGALQLSEPAPLLYSVRLPATASLSARALRPALAPADVPLSPAPAASILPPPLLPSRDQPPDRRDGATCREDRVSNLDDRDNFWEIIATSDAILESFLHVFRGVQSAEVTNTTSGTVHVADFDPAKTGKCAEQ